MKLSSGLQNQKIEIYSDQDVKNESGGVEPNTVLYWATAANVYQSTANRSIDVGVENLKPTIRFNVRDRQDKNVQPDMLVKWRGAWFTIIECRPDFVYVERMTIYAAATTLPQRTPPVALIAEYGYSDTDYYNNESNIPFQFEKNITGGSTELIIPFGILASGKYHYVRIPTGQPVFTKYHINNDNNGNIPSIVYRAKLTLNGHDYYLSRSPIFLNTGETDTKFTADV